MNAPVSITKPLKVRKVGNSLGIVLTKDLLEAMGVGEGDSLYPVQTEEGIRLMPYDPEFADVIKSVERTRRRYRNTLRELAK